MHLIVFFSPAYALRDMLCKKSYKGIMLNSQHRSNKKNNPTPSSHANYFFYCAVPKDSQRFPQAVWRSHQSFLLSPSGQSIAPPAAAWQLRYSFIFFD